MVKCRAFLIEFDQTWYDLLNDSSVTDSPMKIESNKLNLTNT